MVAINKKDENDGVHIRRVLISYLFKTHKTINFRKVTYYHGTKLIDADPYFSAKGSSHKYILKNGYYKLTDANNNNAVLYGFEPDIYEKRRYHSFGAFTFEFTATNPEEAINRFRNRKELK